MVKISVSEMTPEQAKEYLEKQQQKARERQKAYIEKQQKEGKKRIHTFISAKAKKYLDELVEEKKQPIGDVLSDAILNMKRKK